MLLPGRISGGADSSTLYQPRWALNAVNLALTRSDINAKKIALAGENPKPVQLADAEPRRRLGGRSARVLDVVANAVLHEMGENGIENLSIPLVAKRAGVSNSSVYRRWPTKAALIAFACAHLAEDVIPIPDRGSIRDDLIRVLVEVHDLMKDPRSRGLIALSFTNSESPEVVVAQQRYWKSRFEHQQEMFGRALQRGEIVEGTDTTGIIERAVGPLYFRFFVSRRPVTTEFLEGLADAALATTFGGTRFSEAAGEVVGGRSEKQCRPQPRD